MMKLNALLYVACSYLLTGCGSLRQEVEPKGMTQEAERLVITCFISPQDTLLAARVSHSLPVLGTGNEANPDILNATVTLSDGIRSVVLKPSLREQPYGGAYTLYSASVRDLPIVVSKAYTLTARVPDGREVTATCTIPGPVALEEVLIDTAITSEFGDRRKSYFARLRWKDVLGQVNFYRVAGNNEYAQRYSTWTSPGTPPRDTTFWISSNWIVDRGSLSNDQNRDGGEMISARIRLAPYSYTYHNGVWASTPPSGKLEAYLLNVDENYYRYHDAIERQGQVRDNPFAEPVLIPSNIQGGLGCFGAYNRSTLTMHIK